MFDLRCVSTGIRVSVNTAPVGLPVVKSTAASITIGGNWVVNEGRFRSLAPAVDFQSLQAHLEDM